MSLKVMPDGWHKYNPNNVKCDCGSSDVEFLWDNSEVHGFRCLDCGEIALESD